MKALDRGKGGRPVDENWDDYGFGTYVKLAPGADPSVVAKKLTSIQANMLKDVTNPSDFRLQPLSEIHLHAVEGNDSANKQVGITGVVALLLLSIGCINYVNLTTARATRRSKEIGIRKVVGAGSRQLAIQLLVESVLTLCLSLILSIGLLQGILPFYASITGKSGGFSLLDPQDTRCTHILLYPCRRISRVPDFRIQSDPCFKRAFQPSERRLPAQIAGSGPISTGQ